MSVCVCDGNDVGRPTFLRLFYFNRPTRDYFEYAIIPIFFFVGTVTYTYTRVSFTNIIYISCRVKSRRLFGAVNVFWWGGAPSPGRVNR